MGTEHSTPKNDKAENNGAVETRDDDVDGVYAPNKPATAAPAPPPTACPPIPGRQGVWRTRSHILQVHDGKMVTSVDPEMLTREQVDKKPYVISFIGETQEGKSFLLGKILECFRWSKSGLPRPIGVVGVPSVPVGPWPGSLRLAGISGPEKSAPRDAVGGANCGGGALVIMGAVTCANEDDDDDEVVGVGVGVDTVGVEGGEITGGDTCGCCEPPDDDAWLRMAIMALPNSLAASLFIFLNYR
ncbi:hypothetical protein Pelo_3 [Pelomyxa schiedti]|nr:hypothetical protein Pelo_3 [Pelomyxa schiedti]